ncbi:MAG: S9 family peptidase, partial [Pseudomonadota bacterium]
MRKFVLALVSFSAIGACANMENANMSEPKAGQVTTTKTDQYQWLEDVNGERALNWVRAHNEPSLARLRNDPRYQGLENDAMAIIRATDRLTFGGYSQGYVTNFWQDATQVRGLWRRATFASWRSGSPQWETILDIDKLARDEGKNWVYKGSSCLDPNDQWNTTCMISLSDGGKDAVVEREFDIKTRTFVVDGFNLPEAKSDFTWVDKDTLLVATDWGEGSLTESGYPYIVKTLKRGQVLAKAVEVFRGSRTDVSGSSFRFDDVVYFHHFFNRGPTFFTSKTFYMGPNNQPQELALPSKASIIGLREGKLYFSIEENWQPRGNNQTYPTGSLLSAPLTSLIATSGQIDVNSYFSPSERTSLQGASLTKDA